MFDLVFNGFAAFNQIFMLFGSFICLAVGGFMVGNALYWQFRAERVKGTIVGVSQKGQFYYSVYEYMLSDGRTIQATADSGSTSTKGRKTGDTLTLYVFPNAPEKVRQSGTTILFTLVGLCFLVPALVLGKVALTAFPFTPMTGVVGAGLLVVAVFKIKKHIIPKSQRLSPEAWRAARKAENAAEMGVVKPVEEIVESPEAKEAAAKQQKTNRKIAPFILVAGIVMLGFAFHIAQQTQTLAEKGLSARGEVVRLEDKWDHDVTMYYPVVSFTDAAHNSFTFKDSAGSNPPMYHPGEKVTVRYLGDDPQKSAKIDHGIWNWIPVAALTFFGLVLAFAGFKILSTGDRAV